MKRYNYTVLEYTDFIAASPEAVFRVIADPRSKLTWVPAIRRVELETGAPPGLGTRYLASAGVGPLEFTFHEQITAWVENRHVAYGGHSPWGGFKAEVNLEAQGTGTRLSYRMDYTFPGGKIGAWIGRMLTFVYRRRVEASTAARFKEVVEKGLWKPESLLKRTFSPGRSHL